MKLFTTANQPSKKCAGCGATEFDRPPYYLYPSHRTEYGWSVEFRQVAAFCDLVCLARRLERQA